MDENISLKMVDICKYYPGVKALDNVSIELRKGEVHALLGENGAGKSTLCKIIAGAVPMDKGEYYLFGEKVGSLTPLGAKEKGISMIYQDFNLVPYLKVYENLFLGKELMRGPNTDPKSMIQKTEDFFERFQVDIDPRARVCDLSNAYKQLVEIAKAILDNARIICMDEPTAPLTNKEVAILFNLIASLKKQGVSIIYITHRLEELFEVSDRITVMRDGCLVQTLETKDADQDQLIRMMVGRTLSNQFPKRKAEIGEELLRVEHLSTDVTKIQDVSFTLHKGEVLGFSGLVGAGRTEVMRALFGVDPKTAGDISIKGRKVVIKKPADAIADGISFIPEDRKSQGVSLTLTVRENISFAKLKALQGILSINRKKERQLAQKYIAALEIKTPSMEQPAQYLSGGNQQKVAIAKWLVMNSDIIILDEPTHGIDVGAKYDIYLLINKLVQEGKSVILISSEMPELIGMSDRILVMYQGRLAGELTGDLVTQENILNLASGRQTGGDN